MQADVSEHKPLWPVLAMSVATLVVCPFIIDSFLGRVATSLLIGGTALVALERSEARRPVILGGEIALVVATALSIVTRDIGSAEDWLTAVAVGLYCLLLLVTPLVVVYRLAHRPSITLDTVAGLLAAYIQIGLFFSALYRFIDLVDNGPFFTGVTDTSLMDFQFFSFVTLTTLGYGNLVPASDVGQSLAVMEAVLGQVFLVTVVALAVGNIGAALPKRGQAGPR